MAEFSDRNQPKGRGRPKGSKNKRQILKPPLINSALKHVENAVAAGEQWAILAVIDRQFPKLKAITPDDSIDGELIKAKIFETYELEQRVIALEEQSNVKK